LSRAQVIALSLVVVIPIQFGDVRVVFGYICEMYKVFKPVYEQIESVLLLALVYPTDCVDAALSSATIIRFCG